MGLPISVPLQVTSIVSLSIGKGDHPPAIPCYLRCKNKNGESFDVLVSLDEMTKLVNWIQNEQPDWPLRVASL